MRCLSKWKGGGENLTFPVFRWECCDKKRRERRAKEERWRRVEQGSARQKCPCCDVSPVTVINQSLGSMFRVIMQSAIMRMCWLYSFTHTYTSLSRFLGFLSDLVQASTNKDGLMARGKCKRVLSQLTELPASLSGQWRAVTAHYICWACTCVFMPWKLKHLDFWDVLNIGVNSDRLNMLCNKWGSWKHCLKLWKIYSFLLFLI